MGALALYHWYKWYSRSLDWTHKTTLTLPLLQYKSLQLEVTKKQMWVCRKSRLDGSYKPATVSHFSSANCGLNERLMERDKVIVSQCVLQEYSPGLREWGCPLSHPTPTSVTWQHHCWAHESYNELLLWGGQGGGPYLPHQFLYLEQKEGASLAWLLLRSVKAKFFLPHLLPLFSPLLLLMSTHSCYSIISQVVQR